MTKNPIIVWEAALQLLPEGATLKNGAYQVVESGERRIRLMRVATGSPVIVTRRKVEKTAERLFAGEEIPFRSIDYTVAIETGVLAALGDLVQRDVENRVYRLAVQ